jgi:hypothetical protein
MPRNTDHERFRNCLTACAELYRVEVSKPAADMWWLALKGYDIAAVERAFQKHVTNPDNGQFMPKPADIIRMIGGTTLDSAMTAWAVVDRAVRQVGPYASVVFDDPVIHRVIADMGGWIRLCTGTKDEKDWPFVGNEFRTRYKGSAMRDQFAYPEHLIGLAEQNGRPFGECMRLIGNPDGCTKVLKHGVTMEMLSFGPERVPAQLEHRQ